MREIDAILHLTGCLEEMSGLSREQKHEVTSQKILHGYVDCEYNLAALDECHKTHWKFVAASSLSRAAADKHLSLCGCLPLLARILLIDCIATYYSCLFLLLLVVSACLSVAGSCLLLLAYLCCLSV